jgi:hypothetical protein
VRVRRSRGGPLPSTLAAMRPGGAWQTAARRGAILAACAIGPPLIAACGGGGASDGTSTVPAPPARTVPSALTVTVPAQVSHLTTTAPARVEHPGPRRRRPPLGPPIGTAQRTSSQGALLTITVQRLIDPLTGSGASLLPGTRAVAIIVALSNAGPALYDSSATGDFSVLVSRGSVTPVFVPRGTCQTPVEDFDRYMTPGEHRSGCVAFAVDDGARIIGAEFSPHAAALGRLRWAPAKRS